MLSGQATNALRLMPYKNLYALVNRRADHAPVSWEHLSNEALAKLNVALVDLEVFNHVASNNIHPTLDELLVIIENDFMHNNFGRNLKMLHHLNKKTISQAQYLQILGYEQKALANFLSVFSKNTIAFLYDQKLLSLEEISNLSQNQITILDNDIIQYLLIPELMPLEYTSIGDDTQTPILNINRAKSLTTEEFRILITPDYQKSLCKRQISVNELITKHQELKSPELVLAHTTLKSAQQILHIPNFPGATPALLQTLNEFDREFINAFLQSDNKAKNTIHLAILADLSDENKSKLNNFKPRHILNLFFKYNVMSLERILLLTADELDFIIKACGNNALRQEILDGRFEQLYAEARANRPAVATVAPQLEPAAPCAVQTRKDELTRDLNIYCQRVNDNYDTGFKFFILRQSSNRRANHDLAKHLITNLQSCTSMADINTLFSRSNIKNSRQKQTCFNTVNSRELNRIIKRGRSA